MARKVKLDFVPSKYQEAIFDWVQHGVGNAVIQAFAGASKTTTCVSAMKFIPKDQKCLFIAFNNFFLLPSTYIPPAHLLS